MLKENLIETYAKSFRDNWDLPALSDYFKHETFTYGELSAEIAKLHLLFAECGIKRGDKIALIGRNNPRWGITFFAAITYGAVIVPILQDFNANDVHHILSHSESVLLFAGDQLWDIIDTERADGIRAAFSLTDFECIFYRDSEESGKKKPKITKQDVGHMFRKKYPKGFRPKDMKYAKVPNSDMVLLNYTSGTTGFTKGVMLAANNLMGNIVFGRDKVKVHFPGTKALAFLPMAHAYGCTVDLVYPLAMGSHVVMLGKIPSPKILMEAMAEVKPNVVFTVPLILEKIYRKQILPQLETGVAKLALRLPLFDTSIYAMIRKKMVDAFGGKFYEVVVGGAPLNAEVEAFLLKIKFPFTIGYGMTECAPLISCEDLHDFKQSSCGSIHEPTTEARIDSPDPKNIPGELHVRGENVMIGYYKNKEATDAVLTADGWLNTGDVGTMDEDGTIYLRGRSKTMILGPSGQNIYPEEIESKLNNLTCVMESIVVSRDGKLVALVYPDADQADLLGIRDEELEEVMKSNLATLNQNLASYEKVSEIILYPNEFEKTPKKSIKRYLYNV